LELLSHNLRDFSSDLPVGKNIYNTKLIKVELGK